MILEVNDLKFSSNLSEDSWWCIIKLTHILNIFQHLVLVKGTQLLETGSVSVIGWKCEVYSVGSIVRLRNNRNGQFLKCVSLTETGGQTVSNIYMSVCLYATISAKVNMVFFLYSSLLSGRQYRKHNLTSDNTRTKCAETNWNIPAYKWKYLANLTYVYVPLCI
jgi:hypothetical protein